MHLIQNLNTITQRRFHS